MTKERAYIYEPGARGIPFNELLQREPINNPTEKTVLISGSGRMLVAGHREGYLNVQDLDDEQFILKAAMVSDEAVEFDLRTRPVAATDVPLTEDHHPDMFAKQFIGYALALFSQ